MNILISGNLSCLTSTLVRSFLKEKYKAVLVGSDARSLDLHYPHVTTHAISPTDEGFREIVSAYKFDAVIYIGTREEQLQEAQGPNSGQVLDGLLNTLELCRAQGIEKIFFLSSTEVYGDAQETSEKADPHPAAPNGFTLKTGEQYCQYYSEQYGLNLTVIRVPFLYSADEKDTFLYHTLKSCRKNKRVTFPAGENTPLSFLYAEDAADFILRALDEYVSGYQAVNLSGPNAVTLGQLAEMLHARFPGTLFAYERQRRIFTQPVSVSNAKKIYDWIAEDHLAAELARTADGIEHENEPKVNFFGKLKLGYTRYQAYLKWIELLLGAAAMVYLTNLSGSFVEFRYVDFRLIFVVLMGSMYGTQMGLAASVLAGLSVLLGWSKLEMDWTELIYNVANWLPFAVYLTAGAITGYLQDKKDNDINFQNEQNQLILSKYTFLYNVYQEVCQIKDQLHEQLVGSRDSFGRVFNITRELDTLEEEEVLFKALNILEDVMENRSIAIYSIDPANCYARLEINSSALGGQVAKSLNLSNFPGLVDSLEKGDIFQNREVQPGYPAYFAPIKNGSAPVAAVAIWDVKFDQYSLHYYNLFKVVCGLIQSSINRATLFMNANIDLLYLPATRILQPEPFKRVLRTKNKMKKNKLGDYLLVKVSTKGNANGSLDWEKLNSLLTSEIRAEDYMGLLDDGSCCVLFSQADQASAQIIYQRLEQLGIRYELITEQIEALSHVAEPEPIFVELKSVNALRG